MNNNIYAGKRTPAGCEVTVNGRPLRPRFDLRNHSPDGFEWGYCGSGPSQLALAILAHELGSIAALQWYQQFKFDVISGFIEGAHVEWTIEGLDVREWYAEARGAAAAADLRQAVNQKGSAS